MPEQEISGIVITIFSTASSVGKTLIAVNMASELAREGHRVCVVDFDLQFGDVANYLKLGYEKSVFDAVNSLKDNPNANIMGLLTKYSHNNVTFDVLPAPRELSQAYNMDSKECAKIIEKLRMQYDYIVVDTTSMFSVLNLAMLDISTIVTFLGIVDFIPTIKNMKIGNDTLHTLNYDANKIRLVLNRSDAKTRIDMNDVEKLLGDQFYHILPNDFGAANQSIASGIPLVLSDRTGSLTEGIRALVALYTNKSFHESTDSSDKAPSGGWLSKIFS